MNIVDALKQNKKVVVHGDIAEINTSGYLFWASGELIEAIDLLSEYWEPCIEKKEIVINDVKWYKSGGVVYPTSPGWSFCSDNEHSWDKLLNKPLMTMTLTWEE